MISEFQQNIRAMLDENSVKHSNTAGYYKFVLILSVILGTITISVDTSKTVHLTYGSQCQNLEMFFYAIILLDYFVRIFRFPIFHPDETVKNEAKTALHVYLTSFNGVVDILSTAPFFMILFNIDSPDIKTTFGILAFLKIARYSPALTILKDVIISERKPLLAALYLMLLLTFSTSTILYFVERTSNPAGFESIPHAMWWSIVTLATLGYGDVVPLSALGRVLGGIAAIMGFGMFALPAGILANGFADEIKRLRDVSSWNMVVKVPLFSSLDSGIIYEIASLLRVKRFIRNEVIVKEGDSGDAMYFIVEGDVKVSSGNWSTTLNEGDFFGEIALIKDMPRTATVTALKRCEVLKLTTYDFKKSLSNRPEILSEIEKIAEQRMNKK